MDRCGCDGRVVKALDLKSNGVSPRRFEPCSQHQFQVVGPDGPLVVGAGEDLILPCSLKPSISAVDMTVEWSRLHTSDSLVHLYKDDVDRNEYQFQSYRGRTSLFKEELQKGNTSLKLSKVKVSDEGKYKCYIQSKDWSDDITVQVNVEAVGTQPVISMEGYSIGKGLSLLCESNDWRPEPTIVWLDNDGKLLPAEDTETLSDPERFHVKRRVTAQDRNTNRFSCRVIMRDHMKETEIVISKDVTLDPDTAHPLLMLSADGKQVTYEDEPQELSENDKRFVERVVKGSIERVKHIERRPENGFWIFGLLYETYMARAGPNVSFSLKKNPETVGVFVDFEEGVVSFYDVEAGSLIYSFTGQTFTETLYPYFAPFEPAGGQNSAPLIITPVSHTE
ncbi:butyrophilin subfamily 3 member A3-like [Chanos chanos]|uniref:Butyrophilin subfamily 3 member A3-like n=1 Tax=Chanos chanos TaxID=29144 RepID=A0A6J2VVC4_CHACN|nr:butyrophilin subfamily 3 member A3-like [Chanos chanos]